MQTSEILTDCDSACESDNLVLCVLRLEGAG